MQSDIQNTVTRKPKITADIQNIPFAIFSMAPGLDLTELLRESKKDKHVYKQKAGFKQSGLSAGETTAARKFSMFII